MKDFRFDDETFEMLTVYAHMTNNKEYNEKRARIIGIPAKDVQVAPGANVRIPLDQIGENCFLGLYSYFNGNVTIGKDVLVGPHCSIVGGNHKFDAKTGSFSARTEKDYDNSIVIGDGTWISTGVTVTAGVKIGKCNLICAGAVVTKSTEDYSIMAGVPAKKVGCIDPESGEYVWFKK